VLRELLTDTLSEPAFHRGNATILEALRRIGHGLEDNHMCDDALDLWNAGDQQGAGLCVEFCFPVEVSLG